MPKITDIYERICSWENLLAAYYSAAKGKWDRREVAAFSARLEENLIEIQNELIWRTYEVGRYREFYIYEPKKRLIMALSFRDRVVQWAVYRQLNPLLDRQFYEHSYGCRVGKGRVKAADQLQKWVDLAGRKPVRWYFLKVDIAKYFYRVSHEVLMRILRDKVDDEGLLWLMDTIINCEHTAFGLPSGFSPDEVSPGERLFDRGMPIGNLTSQLLANLYLDRLDKFIKHELREHCAIRYMDDVIILSGSRERLAGDLARIERFLADELRLKLNRKTQINTVRHGIEFVGYRIRPGRRKLKRKSLRKMLARIRHIEKEYAAGAIGFRDVNATMQSYFGDMRHYDSGGIRAKLAGSVVFRRREIV